MRHQSKSISVRQRSWAYVVMWGGFFASLLLLALHLFEIKTGPIGPVVGLACGGLLAVAFNRNTDDYFRSLCAVGQKFLTFYIGAYLLLIWMAIELHGDGVASGPVARVLVDEFLVAIIAAVVFYSGYAFAYLRDVLTSRSAE